MLTKSEGELRTEMLRTVVLNVKNNCLPQSQKVLLRRIKNQHNVYMSASAASCNNDENPQNLPHQPVPDLNKTLCKYLTSTTPFLSKDEFEHTKKLVEDFAGPCGLGKKLQEYLLKRAETHTNWLEKWWLDTAYLGYRDPVTIFSSPGQSLPCASFDGEEDKLKYAANIILAALAYKELIDNKKIPVEKMGKFQLDMKQYEKIIGTCRIPALPKDKLVFCPKSKHIVVAHNNHLFKVTVLTEKDAPFSQKELIHQLKFCLAQSIQPGPGVGLLTSQYRDSWAEAYAVLISDSKNEQLVKEIETSLFLVCFDKASPASPDNRVTTAMKQFIHGGGTGLNSGNRWYDKTLQFILGPCGDIGLTYEHSPSEALPVVAMVDFMHNHINQELGKKIPDAKKLSDPIRLNFNLNSKLKLALKDAAKNINKIASNLEVSCFKYKKYGKEFIKSQKLSPDSYIQMAIQCAFYKTHKKPGAHYESAGTRIYVGGRTETIRSCSCEAVVFAKILFGSDAKLSDKVEALRAAIAEHKKYTIDAIQGFGVDRHLLGLRLAAAELSMEVPEIFEDVGWKRSSHMRIASSQVPTKCDAQMGYAPLVKDGYGVCYNPRSDDINFSVSAFEDYHNTSAFKYKANLESCLDEMQKILLKTTKSKM